MVFSPDLEQLNPDAHTQPFWDACRRRELRFQRCTACGRFRHPPLPGCPYCGATALEWVQVRGRGRVFSYTIVHHPTLPLLKDAVPYNVVVVEFDDAPGARLVSNVLGVRPEEVRVGMGLELAWDETAPELVLPRFRPAS